VHDRPDKVVLAAHEQQRVGLSQLGEGVPLPLAGPEAAVAVLRSRHLLRVLLFMPFVLSPLAVSYVWKFIYQPAGPLNSFLSAVGLDSLTRVWLGDASTAIMAIIIVMIWQNIGITMVIYLAGLANVPMELEEAAAVDGAGPIRRFRHVVLAMLRPAVSISTTLLLIQGLRVFDQVLALTNGGPFGASETMATLVYKYSFVKGQFGYGAALSVLLTILIVVISIMQNVAQRQKES
jgi:raffinose/stachyose/melibiose transport system permease protein